MHASTIGSRALPVIRPQSLEAIKWTAVVLMLLEHASFYVFGQMPAVVLLLGRSVFPMFSIALAVGISGSAPADCARVLVRIVSWGIVAAATGALVREAFPANVMFTLALGLVLHIAWRSRHWTRYAVAVVALLAGFAVEYGPLGVFGVALMCSWAREQGASRGLVYLAVGVAAICVSNGNVFAVAAPLIAFALDRGDITIPRIPRLFYWVYAGQWPVFAALKVLV